MKTFFLSLFGATVWATTPQGGLKARGAMRSRLSQMCEASNKTDTDLSLNWSGAVLNAPPSGTTFTSVSAEFSVPSPEPVNGQAGSSSIWVGIDGNTYRNAILQTGIDLSVTSDGSTSFDAWYEWYPDYAYGFPNITITAGDRISLYVVSTSSSSGIVTVENLTSGQKASQSLTAPDPSSILGGQNAEWIVEDYEEGGHLVVLDNFGIVTFSDTSAGLSDGSFVAADGADIINILQNGEVLTSVTLGPSEITITSRSEEESLRIDPEDDRIKFGYT
jgi:hypothetical protein